MKYTRICTQLALNDALVGASQLHVEINVRGPIVTDLVFLNENGQTLLRVRPGMYQCSGLTVETAVLPTVTTKYRLRGMVSLREGGVIKIDEIFDAFVLADGRRYDLHRSFGHDKCILAVERVDADKQTKEVAAEVPPAPEVATRWRLSGHLKLEHAGLITLADEIFDGWQQAWNRRAGFHREFGANRCFFNITGERVDSDEQDEGLVVGVDL